MELKARIGLEIAPAHGRKSAVENLLPCTISNLSLGGMRIAVLSHQTMLANARVRLYVDIDGSGRELELSGIVRWRHIKPGSPAHTFGVEFLVPEKKILDRWLSYTNNIFATAPPKDLIKDTSGPWSW
jgi:hypothetical protein